MNRWISQATAYVAPNAYTATMAAAAVCRPSRLSPPPKNRPSWPPVTVAVASSPMNTMPTQPPTPCRPSTSSESSYR